MQPFVERTTRDNQFWQFWPRENPNTYVTHLAPLTRALHLFGGKRHPHTGGCFCLSVGSGLMAGGRRGLRVLDLASPGAKSFSYLSCHSLIHQSTGCHIVEALLISHVKDVLFCKNSNIKLERDQLSPVNKAVL